MSNAPDYHDTPALAEARSHMVRTQIEGRGIRDPRVLETMKKVPRHLFLPEPLQAHACEDRPLPIACEQTISQPYMVALMTELLLIDAPRSVLEVGTGSGYQTAVLSRLVDAVTTIERHSVLFQSAKALLNTMGCANVSCVFGDGTLGYPPNAPYDAILVTAGAPEPSPALLEQLVEGGCLVVPIGNTQSQRLTRIVKRDGAFLHERGVSCRFVPLLGSLGWPVGDFIEGAG